MANTNGVSRVQEYNMADFENYETFGPNMTRDETHDWFVKKLARTPGHEDVYAVAKEFYHLGAFSRSLSCLQYYITLQGASNIGRHLLGYCYLNLGDSERALREFKKAVRDGFADDWQLIVELIHENDLKLHRETDEL